MVARAGLLPVILRPFAAPAMLDLLARAPLH